MSMLEDTRKFWRRDRVFDWLAPEPEIKVDVSHQVILYIEGLSVSFDGFKALNDLNLYNF